MHTQTHTLCSILKLHPTLTLFPFVNISCGQVFKQCRCCPQWDDATHTQTWIYAHSSPRTHICFPILASWTLPAKLAFLFLIVSAKTWLWSCSVSVCRRLWVPSCIFLFPSIFSSVSLSPTPLPFSLILSPALSLLLYYFCFLSFFLQISPSLFPPRSFSPSLVLSLFFPFSSSSGLIEVQYCMLANCFPSLSTISDGLLQHTTQHGGCWAWEAQAFALYNHVRLLLQSLNHAKSEHLLPAHSRRVGPSA